MNTKMQNFVGLSDLISLMNMSCGFLSVLMSINHDFYYAAIFMILSLVDTSFILTNSFNDFIISLIYIFMFVFSSIFCTITESM